MTLTAIRATVVGLRDLAATGPSPTASPTGIGATAKPTVTELEPPPTEAIASATPQLTEAAETATDVEDATPLPFYFAYLIPTPTAYGSVEDSLRIDCEVEQDWLSYEVRRVIHCCRWRCRREAV